MAEQIKLIVVKTKEQGLFISDNIEGKDYFSSRIPHLFFDNLKLVATFKKDWYKISDIPQKIEKQGQDTYNNKRYELKEGFPVSNLTPKIISDDDWEDDSEISGLYKYQYDIIKGDLEALDFEIEILSEEDNFYIEKPKYKSTPSLMTALTTHPGLHTEKPCSITGKDLYVILRSYIKLNINPRYAKVTSDYDFCFTVQKVISHAPESYQVNVGKRKPKYETGYKRERTVKVLETSPEGYSNYPRQEGISAKNQKELEEKIDKYLEDTLEIVNRPYVECECCGGLGVIIDKK